MTSQHGTHNDLHSEQGALPAEHPGRAKNPTIKVLDLAWLEFVKPDLAASERFAHAFGFTTVSRTADELQLRGTDAGGPCVIVRRGTRGADRSERGGGPGCRRHPRARNPAGPADAGVQLRARRATRQRHAAPAS